MNIIKHQKIIIDYSTISALLVLCAFIQGNCEPFSRNMLSLIDNFPSIPKCIPTLCSIPLRKLRVYITLLLTHFRWSSPYQICSILLCIFSEIKFKFLIIVRIFYLSSYCYNAVINFFKKELYFLFVPKFIIFNVLQNVSHLYFC